MLGRNRWPRAKPCGRRAPVRWSLIASRGPLLWVARECWHRHSARTVLRSIPWIRRRLRFESIDASRRCEHWKGTMTSARNVPRIVIAGAASSVGKTTVTAGLIAALRQQGLIVQPFKCGPDYIDPSYHERAAGRPCRNLDTWMLSDSQLLETFARACQDADIAIVEGVMGLYDGSDWHDERGSTAQIAKLLGAPVLLVFDISGSARSAAAAVLGYTHFDPAVAIRRVVLNFAGSEGHAKGCAGAIERATALPMMGWLPRDMQLQIPERHLGLVPGGEQVDSDALIAQMAAAVSARFDVSGIVGVAKGAVSGTP